MEQETKKRITWLDTVRVLACLMVVFIHSPIPNKENPLMSSYLLGGLSYLASSCIGLFFMVSGALLFPIKMPLKDFLKKRFLHILFPTIIWSLFYIAVKFFYNELDLNGVSRLILQIPFDRTYGHFWFLYTLIGLYLFAPIISKWIEEASEKDLQYFLMLWLIVMCFPYINIFITMQENEYRMLSTFSGFMGYMVLGYYLKKFPIDLSFSPNIIKIIGSILILSIILPFIFYVVPFNGHNSSKAFQNYLSINVVMMCVGWFVLAQNMNKMHSNVLFSKVMKEFSVLSFGIYLVHGFVLYRWVWLFMPIGVLPLWLEIVVVALSTFILSYLIIKLISKLPLKKYIIG